MCSWLGVLVLNGRQRRIQIQQNMSALRQPPIECRFAQPHLKLCTLFQIGRFHDEV